MAKSVRYKDGTLMMPGSRAMELYLDPPKAKTNGVKVETLEGHMAELDKTWRKVEGRKPVAELTEREKMLEGRIPWDPTRLKTIPEAEPGCVCYLCAGVFKEDQGENFQPYDVVDLPDNDLRWVCSTCEEGPQHQKNLSETDLNHRADESYQARYSSGDEEG